MPWQCHGPRARPVPWAARCDFKRGDLSRGRLGVTSSEATCPVGGGSAAVKPPHRRQRITGRHLVKGTTTSMYCKPLACTPPHCQESDKRCHRPPLARDQVPRAVACHGPPRATCPVGGGSAAVKRPALPSRHHRPPPCKRHNHVDVLQALACTPCTVKKATSVAIAVSAIYPRVIEWFSHIKNLKSLIKNTFFLLIKVYF